MRKTFGQSRNETNKTGHKTCHVVLFAKINKITDEVTGKKQLTLTSK